MKVHVGSKNKTKVEAVAESIKGYPLFAGAEVVGVEVATEVFGHPNTLTKTVEGAMDRAKQAFSDCDYSFGLEGGLLTVPHTKTGLMEITACAIFDGKNYHIGLSSAFEWPKKVTELINGGLDGSQALREAGITTHEKIGTAEGGVSILTKGRVNRTQYNKQAITMALVHLEHPEFYQ